MSSREIADLTGKQPHHVKRDIERMFSELQEDVSKTGCIYLDSMNRSQTEYLLDRHHTECLLTGYSAKMRMAVIKRWHELEEQTGNIGSLNVGNQSQGAIIESLSGLQTEVKILKEMIVRSYVKSMRLAEA
ncbi:Rha family transcriptional regulator [Pseudomonas syringae]|uniref:Rha family transcriptional regulator n=1 Tax=Pseudomonas syringae TaxID=317 RepID=UPI0018E627BD|nr:Rha family transcriptional regulator [Pseudomonas syringae]